MGLGHIEQFGVANCMRTTLEQEHTGFKLFFLLLKDTSIYPEQKP